MCNLPLGSGRRPYSHDALSAGPVHEYEVSPNYSPSPEQQAALPFYNEECEYLHLDILDRNTAQHCIIQFQLNHKGTSTPVWTSFTPPTETH